MMFPLIKPNALPLMNHATREAVFFIKKITYHITFYDRGDTLEGLSRPFL